MLTIVPKSCAISSSRRASNCRRKLVITHYRVSEDLERVARRFINVDMHADSKTDADLFSEDFTAYADGVRVVNDLTKDQHLALQKKLLQSKAVKLSEGYFALSSDDTVFMLFEGTTNNGVSCIHHIGRFAVNEGGQVNKLWSRRGVASSEMELLKEPELVASRMAALPKLRVKTLIPDQRRHANMLAGLDSYIEAMNTVSDTERIAHVESFATEDFQQWEGTGVWAPLADAVRCSSFSCPPGGPSSEWKRDLVANRNGFSRAIGVLIRHLGGEERPGRMVSVVRSKAASKSQNLAFLHFDTLSITEHAPIAFDVMVACVFTSDGMKMKQAMAFRSAACMQEYAGVFNTSTDIARVVA